MSQSLSAASLLAIPLAPLVGALAAGVFGTRFGGNKLGRVVCHSLAISGVFLAFILSAITLNAVVTDGARFNEAISSAPRGRLLSWYLVSPYTPATC